MSVTVAGISSSSSLRVWCEGTLVFPTDVSPIVILVARAIGSAIADIGIHRLIPG